MAVSSWSMRQVETQRPGKAAFSAHRDCWSSHQTHLALRKHNWFCQHPTYLSAGRSRQTHFRGFEVQHEWRASCSYVGKYMFHRYIYTNTQEYTSTNYDVHISHYMTLHDAHNTTLQHTLHTLCMHTRHLFKPSVVAMKTYLWLWWRCWQRLEFQLSKTGQQNFYETLLFQSASTFSSLLDDSK